VTLHRGTQQVRLAVMLTDYIERLMRKAVYDKLEDGSFSGRIPLCPGVIAFGRSLSSCQQELQESLEGWMLVKLRHGDPLPILGRINLNRTPVFSRKYGSHAKSQAL
jgi:predicted RNase H-like HicB family nuclease